MSVRDYILANVGVGDTMKNININLDIFDRVNAKDKAFLSRQLSTMINSGLPLDRAVAILAAQTRKKILKDTLNEINKDLESGEKFSTAISRHPKVFDRVYVNMVISGEAVGKLSEVLTHLADELEKNNSFNSKIQSALVYPIFIIVVMIVIVFIMMTKVIPQLTEIFKESKAELPWATKVLISISSYMISYWWVVLLILIAIVAGIYIFLKTEAGEYLFSKIQIKFPTGIGKDIYMARFARTLSMLLSSGTPIIDAVRITADVMNNKIYKKSLENLAVQLERGIPMSVPLEKDQYFPLVVPQMVMVGEQTGRLDEILNNLANYYEEQGSEKIKGITSLFEPALIVIIGVGVAFIVFSILMPIYQIVQLQ